MEQLNEWKTEAALTTNDKTHAADEFLNVILHWCQGVSQSVVRVSVSGQEKRRFLVEDLKNVIWKGLRGAMANRIRQSTMDIVLAATTVLLLHGVSKLSLRIQNLILI